MVEGSEYKVVHQELLCDLLLLSTSTYSQVKHSFYTSFHCIFTWKGPLKKHLLLHSFSLV